MESQTSCPLLENYDRPTNRPVDRHTGHREVLVPIREEEGSDTNNEITVGGALV